MSEEAQANHIITYKSGEQRTVLEVPADKDLGELLDAVNRKMHPGPHDYSASDKRLADWRAGAAERDRAAQKESAEAAPLNSSGTKFPRSWKPEDGLELDLSEAAEAKELPAGNRTNPGPGARALDQARDVARTPTHEPAAANREDTKRDRGGDSGGREVGLAGENGSPVVAAARSGIRDTSMAAYRALKWSGKLAAQEKLIVDHFLANRGRKFTRQELARDLDLGINAVCGRVKALLDAPMELLVEREKKQCSVTGNSVNALELKEEAVQ